MGNLMLGGDTFYKVYMGGQSYTLCYKPKKASGAVDTTELTYRFADGGVYVTITNPSHRALHHLDRGGISVGLAFKKQICKRQAKSDTGYWEYSHNRPKGWRKPIRSTQFRLVNAGGYTTWYSVVISNIGQEYFIELPEVYPPEDKVVDGRSWRYVSTCTKLREFPDTPPWDIESIDISHWTETYKITLFQTTSGRIIKMWDEEHIIEY